MPYSNETFYTKAREYKCDSEQILKSLEDIQIFFSVRNKECLDQAVSKYMIRNNKNRKNVKF